MNRRSFLRLLGLGATAGAGLVVAEPVRRIWQVSRAAPVRDARFWDEFTGAAKSPHDPWSGIVAEHTLTAERFARVTEASDRYLGALSEHETRAWLPDMPQLREWLGPKAAADWDRDAYRQPVTDSDIAWHLADTPEARVYMSDVEGEDYQRRARQLRGLPIGTLESIDPETGLATVRLGAPLRGWRGTGTA